MAYLDGKLVAFGTVLEGMDVVYLIDRCDERNAQMVVFADDHDF